MTQLAALTGLRLCLASVRVCVNGITTMINSEEQAELRNAEHGTGAILSKRKELPRLPVAPLQESLERYLGSVKPLLTSEEY